jgi:hypothetical protein
VNSGFGNSIYLTLPVVTTIIHFARDLSSPSGIIADFLLNLSSCVTFQSVTLSLCLYPCLLSYSKSESESESHVTTDSQSASLSWNKAPIWGLRPDINYCLTITVLFLWGALSDERTGLSFVYATGPRQCSPSWV